MSSHFKGGAWALALILGAALAGCDTGSDLPQPGGGGPGGGDGTDDGGGGGIGPKGQSIFMQIVPPGSNGNSAGGIGGPAPFPVFTYPDNYRDQLDLYGNLSYAQQGLKSDPCTPPASIAQHAASSDQACNYFKDAPIELPPGQAVSTITLTAPNLKTVTIQRDGWGVPYIDGQDRAAAEFGMGYAAAQDRLWLFDLLRYVGRGKTSEILGPAPTTYDLDLQFGGAGGYDEAELTQLVNAAVAKITPQLGGMFLNDVQFFVAGMNRYVEEVNQLLNLGERPPEYVTLGLNLPSPTLTPHRLFTVEDIVANAVLIQAQFGRGGGGEASNVNLLQKLDPSFSGGASQVPFGACRVWRDLRHANDKEAAYTITGTEFHTQSPPSVSEACPQTLPAGAAIWDVDSLRGRPFLRTGSNLLSLPAVGSVTTGLLGSVPIPFPAPSFPKGAQADANYQVVPTPFKTAGEGRILRASADPTEAMHKALDKIGLPKTSSNWIGVNANQTKDGHPIIVAGPQTSYFMPQLLWEVSVVSRGNTPYELAARGITTVNLPYVVIGHGLDFGWSATSAGSDLIDTRVSVMCNTDGSPVGGNVDNNFDGDGDGFPDADGYFYKGQCVRFYKRLDQWFANPTPASIALGCAGGPGPDCHPVGEDVDRFILRTHYGPVTATATVQGTPVAISEQRSTFFGDVDTTAPFALLTTKSIDMNERKFRELFNSMTSTFNWIYADNHDLSYIQSGLYPIRHPLQHPELPVWGDGYFEWGADQNLPADFFTRYGGNGNDGALSFPSRAVPVAQGDPLDGYFEWPGYLPLSAHIQQTNPDSGFFANWNNAGAKGWWAADSNGTYGPTHRQRMLAARLEAFKASGRKHDVASMIEIMADAAFTDLRGQTVLALLIDYLDGQATNPLLSQVPDLDTLDRVLTLMRAWRDEGSNRWIADAPGLGSYRRDRDGDGVYDMRQAVVLMDAWYPRLIERLLPQLVQIESLGASVLQGRYDAPRGQGSAYQEGWYEHMKRVLQMPIFAVDNPLFGRYQTLQCGDGTANDCRRLILLALNDALADLGGYANRANWDGTQLVYQKGSGCGTVEACDRITHTSFSLIPVPDIPWQNRPTFQQVTQVKQDRSGNP